MKPKYGIGQRLEFATRNKCVMDGHVIKGKWSHYVGYVKQVRRSLFGVRYMLNVAKSKEIFFVPERDIIGVVDSRKESDETNK